MAFSTTTELALLTERELGHNLGSTASSQRTDIVSHLDRANKLVHAGGGILNYDVNGKRLRNEVVFSFARAQNPKILTLLPGISTATITATRQSASITFGADPNAGTSIAGYFIRINGEDEVYRVASHTAAASVATLDAGYVGPANVAAANCSIFKLHYDVGSSDILQLVSPLRVFARTRDQAGISIVDKDELIDQYPLDQIYQAFPQCAAIVKESAGTVTLQLNSFPDDLERIEVDHIPIPTTLDTSSSDPTMPAQFRPTISYLAAYYMGLRNNDKRSPSYLQSARDMFAEMVEWNEKLTSSGDPDFGRVRIGANSRKSPYIKVQRGYTISG